MESLEGIQVPLSSFLLQLHLVYTLQNSPNPVTLSVHFHPHYQRANHLPHHSHSPSGGIGGTAVKWVPGLSRRGKKKLGFFEQVHCPLLKVLVIITDAQKVTDQCRTDRKALDFSLPLELQSPAFSGEVQFLPLLPIPALLHPCLLPVFFCSGQRSAPSEV